MLTLGTVREGPGVDEAECRPSSSLPFEMLSVSADLVPASALPVVPLLARSPPVAPSPAPLALALASPFAASEAARGIAARAGDEGAAELLLGVDLAGAGDEEK